MRDSRVFWGSAVIVLGVLFLLQNLGIIRVNIWSLIFPVLMILAGVQLIFSLSTRRSAGGVQEGQELSIPSTGVSEAYVRLEHGAGQVFLSNAAAPGMLLVGKFSGGVSHTYTNEGGIARLSLKPGNMDPFFWPVLAPGSRAWNLNLNSDVLLDIHVQSGASDTRLDLTDLLVRSLKVETGASSTTIQAPRRAGFTRMDLQSGAASTSLSIPQGVSARIEMKGALSSIKIDQGRFPANGNIYQSPDYLSAANRLDIVIESGVGSIDIR